MDRDLATVSFYAYYKLASNRARQSLAYRDAIDGIRDHFKRFFDLRKAKYAKLYSRIRGFDADKYRGNAFADLPKSLQDQLANDNYRQLGFKNPAACASWLAQGTLTGSYGSAGLSLGRQSDGVGCGLRIP